MPCAVSEDIMALVVRVILWGIVLLAPGGLLLLPFLAVQQFNKAPKSGMSTDTAGNNL